MFDKRTGNLRPFTLLNDRRNEEIIHSGISVNVDYFDTDKIHLFADKIYTYDKSTGSFTIAHVADSSRYYGTVQRFYSDKDIFLRELVSNGCDAVTKLKKLASIGEAQIDESEKFKVTVSIFKDAKKLVISDNGIGMTAEEIDKYINQIAFSGASDFLSKYKEEDDKGSQIIGHFGLGFYSAFMVAKKVEIITKSYRDGAQAVKWTCDGSPEFTIEEVDKAGRGSDIILYIDDDCKEFLEESRISELLKNIAVSFLFLLPLERKKNGKMANK